MNQYITGATIKETAGTEKNDTASACRDPEGE